MRTSEEIYHRIRWDPRFDPARFVLGVNTRGAEPARVPLPAFVPGGDIPWHRIVFVEADGHVVWDRSAGLDRVDSSQAGRARVPRRLRAPHFMATTPFAWDALEGWRAGQAASAVQRPSAEARIRVLTWNTLWDRYDRHLIDTARRRPLLLRELERADADVIALQEVETELLAMVLGAPWVRSAYALNTDATDRAIADCGLLLLSRLPVREAGRLVLGPHKAVAAITVDSTAGPIVVAVTHLTSDHAQNGAARREAELADLAKALADVEGEVILAGDFNDGGSRPATMLRLRDAWPDVHGSEDRTATFDPQANPLAAVSSLSGRASRIDRVLLRGHDLKAVSAVRVGDSPATADGLFISDHYGVAVDLVGGQRDHLQREHVSTQGHAAPSTVPSASSSTVSSRASTTVRTAVVWIPPDDMWPAIQEIRREHDPKTRRWPPHVTLLFGFVQESGFEEAASILAAAASTITPFTARLEGVGTFPHRDGFTIWLDPAAAGSEPWVRLHDALESGFPQCRSRAGAYVPHLTLGRAQRPERLAADFTLRLGSRSAQVGELVLLSRRGDEPMLPRATIALGTGEVRWIREAGEWSSAAPLSRTPGAAPGRVMAQVRDLFPEGVVHLAGSRRMGCELADADIDLVVALPGSVDMSDVQSRVRAALPEATEVRRVVGARVPGLRVTAEQTVDLIVVETGAVPPADAVSRRTELGEAAAIALSAVSDADAVLASVGAGRRTRFIGLAREVKAWAKARGLDSAPFGGLPGLAWSILAARTVCEADNLPEGDLLRRFFGDWAAWDWHRSIRLLPETHGEPAGFGGAVRILTPTEPIRSCSGQVGVGGRDRLTRELYDAWEIAESAAESGRDPWPELFSAPPLHRRHAAWAVVTVKIDPGEEFGATLGRVRGRMHALLSSLEDAGVVDVQAWPRPFEIGVGLARFAIGLGRTPPVATELARIAAPWTAGLRGTGVSWAECGDVPTLR